MFGLDDIFSPIKDVFSAPVNAIKDIGGGVWNSVLSPVYNGVVKPIGSRAIGIVNGNLNRMDHLADAGTRVVDAAGNVAEGLGSFLSGNSNILLYIAVAGIAIVVVPKIIDKVM
jgi:hypothetical protein